MAMAIVLILTAVVWAERKQERDRERPDRRPEGRSMADRRRGDRGRQEREKRDEREREERERNERGGRDDHRRGKPDVRIFRFEHIPAESFRAVIEQLSRKRGLGEMLSSIPIAVNEHSNAVVVIAPPEALELFEKIAKGLDRPSGFHERMARRKAPGAPKKPAPPKHPPHGQGADGINEEAIGKALGNPVGQFLHKALSEPVIRELRLDKRQIEAMRKVAQQFGPKVGHMRRHVIQTIRNMPPDQRAANARKIVRQVRGEMGKMTGEARKQIFKILTPAQHKAAARVLGPSGPAGAKGKPAATDARGRKPAPTASPGGCGGCAGRGTALSDTGNCKTGDF